MRIFDVVQMNLSYLAVLVRHLPLRRKAGPLWLHNWCGRMVALPLSCETGEHPSTMNLLITGGAGYIGGTVARLLLSRGHGVTIYDNLCHSRREAVPSAATFVMGDLADKAALSAALTSSRFDGVLHFAALIEAGESMKRPGQYFRNNTEGTLSLLECMAAAGIERLVFSSTAACYGEPRQTPIT